MAVWKQGCTWGGGKPSFYNFIKERSIVISPSKAIQKEDLVAIAEGFQIRAIAKIESVATPVTQDQELRLIENDYSINYSDRTFFYESEWIILPQPIEYSVRQGFVQIQQLELVKTLEEIWQNNFDNPSSTNIQYKNSIDIDMLNTILYGPPGTGKTYHTINKALEIIDPDFYSSHKDEDKREALKERFDKLREENKIVLTTFHQSYSYEDFVEGLSAESIDEKLVYGIKDGIFKKIAQNANSQHTSNFEDVYIKLCNDIEENGLTLKTLKRNKPIDIEVSTQQNLVVIPQTETKTRMTITKENLRQLILNGVVGDWSTYTRVIKKYLEDHYNLTTQFQKSNYVLIIDEINRGNVSNIFGELITLIEESKREGKDEALSARLPYSKKPFSVPSNLYIIGTMNTADRSLTQIDTALRRRFHFEEMMPQPELLDSIVIDGIEVDKLLRCLNARIEALYDREHTLGHAFFIELKEDGKNNIETLARIFKNKIIPLLQEYFFDDWGKIQLILGEQVIKEKAQFSNFATPNINNLVIPKTYEIVSGTLKEPDTYITMYKNCLSV
jgi:hypothetical protein